MKSMAIIIGLSGKMGSGKDYIASKYIIPFFTSKSINCIQWSFADQIKVNVMAKRNIAFNDVYISKTKATRTLLQHEGTENGRDIIGKDIWINYFDAWRQILTARGIKVLITSDVRFSNEAEYIKSQGGLLIKIVAPGRNEQRLQNETGGDVDDYHRIKNHASECDLDFYPEFDLEINNDFNQTIDEKHLYSVLNKLVV